MQTQTIKPASAKKRFFNWFMDVIVFSTLIYVLLAIPYAFGILNEQFLTPIALIGVMLQIIVMEQLFGASLGKMITNTRVISKDGSTPYFRQTILRTLVRLIPFEPLSFLRPNPVGWHDSFTNTLVVDKSACRELKIGKTADDRPGIAKTKYVPTILLLSFLFVVFFLLPPYFEWKMSQDLAPNSLEEYMETLEAIDDSGESETNSTAQNDWQAYFLHQDKFEISLPTSPIQSFVELPIKGTKIELDVYESSNSGELFQAGYADIRQLVKQKYQSDIQSKQDEPNPALDYLEEQRSKRLEENDQSDFQKAREEYYFDDSKVFDFSDYDGEIKLAKEDIYQALFKKWLGSREMTKLSDNFDGHNSYDFLWKNSDRGTFIKGKIIIVNGGDLYVLLNENAVEDFPNFERFIYSWHSYGNLSQ